MLTVLKLNWADIKEYMHSSHLCAFKKVADEVIL